MPPEMTVSMNSEVVACGSSPGRALPSSPACHAGASPACTQGCSALGFSDQQYWATQLAAHTKHTRMVLHPVNHWKQLFSWDCGLACALMALKAVGHNCDYSLLRQLCPTTSIWTIDLAHLLRRFGLDVSFYTITLGPNPAFYNESFYLAHMQDDERRVSQLFRDACSAGIAVQQRSVCWQHLAAELMTGCALVLVLVDKRKLDPWLIAADMCLPYALCGMELGYAGHYILLVGWDAGLRQFLVRDPAGQGHGDVPRVSPEALDAARKAFGTDEDVLLVRHPSLTHNLLVMPQSQLCQQQQQPLALVATTSAASCTTSGTAADSHIPTQQETQPDGGMAAQAKAGCVQQRHDVKAVTSPERQQGAASWFMFSQQRGSRSSRDRGGRSHQSRDVNNASSYQGFMPFQAQVPGQQQQQSAPWPASQDHTCSQQQQDNGVHQEDSEQQPLLVDQPAPAHQRPPAIGWYNGWYAYVWQTAPAVQQQQQQVSGKLGATVMLGSRGQPGAVCDGGGGGGGDAGQAHGLLQSEQQPVPAQGHNDGDEQQQGVGGGVGVGSKPTALGWGYTVSGSAWSSFWCWAPAWGMMSTGSKACSNSSSSSTGDHMQVGSRPPTGSGLESCHCAAGDVRQPGHAECEPAGVAVKA